MHAIIATRGIKFDVDKCITQLQGKQLPMTFNGKDQIVDFIVQPIQLWSMVFPKPQLQIVMRSFFIDPIMNPEGKMHWNTKMSKPLAILRKGLGLSKFPELEKDGPKLLFHKQNIEFMGIGMKDDNFEQL